jgi:hypothetical protein
MAKVRIVRGTVAGGVERFPGDVVEVEPGEYRLLVDLCQKAVPFEEPVAGLGHRDAVAAPKKRGRR